MNEFKFMTKSNEKPTRQEINEKFANKLSPESRDIYDKVKGKKGKEAQLKAINEQFQDLKLTTLDMLKVKIAEVQKLLTEGSLSEVSPSNIPTIRKNLIDVADMISRGLIPQEEVERFSNYIDAVDAYLNTNSPQERIANKDNN